MRIVSGTSSSVGKEIYNGVDVGQDGGHLQNLGLGWAWAAARCARAPASRAPSAYRRARQAAGPAASATLLPVRRAAFRAQLVGPRPRALAPAPADAPPPASPTRSGGGFLRAAFPRGSTAARAVALARGRPPACQRVAPKLAPAPSGRNRAAHMRAQRSAAAPAAQIDQALLRARLRTPPRRPSAPQGAAPTARLVGSQEGRAADCGASLARSARAITVGATGPAACRRGSPRCAHDSPKRAGQRAHSSTASRRGPTARPIATRGAHAKLRLVNPAAPASPRAREPSARPRSCALSMPDRAAASPRQDAPRVKGRWRGR